MLGFLVLYHQDILDRLQENNQFHYHLVYLKFYLTNSYKDPDDHATTRFNHKVKIDSLNDHINY